MFVYTFMCESKCAWVLSPQLPLNDSSGRWHWWWCYTVSGTRQPGRGWNHRDYGFVWRLDSWTKPSSCYRILEHPSPSHGIVWWTHFYCCRRSFHTDHRLDPEREEPNNCCHWNILHRQQSNLQPSFSSTSSWGRYSLLKLDAMFSSYSLTFSELKRAVNTQPSSKCVGYK